MCLSSEPGNAQKHFVDTTFTDARGRMAEVAVPASQDTYTSTPSQHHATAPHGKKRAADAPLESEQRLSKRFDLLNLGMCSLNASCVPPGCNG